MRETDMKANRFSLSRFFHEDGLWYVETREGKSGPFHRREDAVQHLEQLKRMNGDKS